MLRQNYHPNATPLSINIFPYFNWIEKFSLVLFDIFVISYLRSIGVKNKSLLLFSKFLYLLFHALPPRKYVAMCTVRYNVTSKRQKSPLKRIDTVLSFSTNYSLKPFYYTLFFDPILFFSSCTPAVII